MNDLCVNCCQFGVNNAIVAILGSVPFKIKKLKNGNIMGEVDKGTQSKKLLKTMN